MTTAEINGVPIRYEDSGGDGPAVIFSHGFMMDRSMFAAQVESLVPDYRCISWDERGFGDTPAPGPFDFWDSASDAIGVLDECGVDEAVFVGMSQGGFLSLRAALANPERVRALVMIDSAADVDDAETIEGYHGMLAAISGDDDATWEAVAEGVAGLILGDPELIAEWVPKWRARRTTSDINVPGQALLARDDVSDRLGEIACPVLVVHGTDDAAIDPARGKAVLDGVQDGRGLVMVDGAAHAPNMSHPGLVNDALADFLAAL